MAPAYLVLFWEYFTTLATDLCNSSGNMVRSPSALTQTPCFMIISLKTQRWILKKNTIHSIIVVGVVTPDVVIRYKRLLFPGTTLRPGKSHLEIKKKPF